MHTNSWHCGYAYSVDYSEYILQSEQLYLRHRVVGNQSTLASVEGAMSNANIAENSDW